MGVLPIKQSHIYLSADGGFDRGNSAMEAHSGEMQDSQHGMRQKSKTHRAWVMERYCTVQDSTVTGLPRRFAGKARDAVPRWTGHTLFPKLPGAAGMMMMMMAFLTVIHTNGRTWSRSVGMGNSGWLAGATTGWMGWLVCWFGLVWFGLAWLGLVMDVRWCWSTTMLLTVYGMGCAGLFRDSRIGRSDS